MPYRIMIACVIVEVAMVASPAQYRSKEIRLFRYSRDSGSRKAKLYEDRYAEVARNINESLPSCAVTEHTDEPVYDLRRMSRSLDMMYNLVVREHPDCEILANVSSGPSEFAAALGIFSYLHPRVVLFKGKMVTYLMLNIGNPIESTNIARGLHMNQRTVGRYLAVAQGACKFYRADRYDLRSTALGPTPKHYVVDPGLRNNAVGMASKDRGRVLENIVYLELRRREYDTIVGKWDSREGLSRILRR
jgi:hypothetical protein